MENNGVSTSYNKLHICSKDYETFFEFCSISNLFATCSQLYVQRDSFHWEWSDCRFRSKHREAFLWWNRLRGGVKVSQSDNVPLTTSRTLPRCRVTAAPPGSKRWAARRPNYPWGMVRTRSVRTWILAPPSCPRLRKHDGAWTPAAT